MRDAIKIMTAILFAIAWISVINMLEEKDVALEARQIEAYCEAVKLWEDGAAYGVSEYDRLGHPDFKGIADKCEKEN